MRAWHAQHDTPDGHMEGSRGEWNTRARRTTPTARPHPWLKSHRPAITSYTHGGRRKRRRAPHQERGGGASLQLAHPLHELGVTVEGSLPLLARARAGACRGPVALPRTPRPRTTTDDQKASHPDLGPPILHIACVCSCVCIGCSDPAIVPIRPIHSGIYGPTTTVPVLR